LISKQMIENLRQAIFIPRLNAGNGSEAIDEMLRATNSNPEVLDPVAFRDAVLLRQQADPPFMPGGIAFPHARTHSVQKLLLVVATAPDVILFDSVEIRLIFLIGVPKNAVNEYLELTSFLARHLRDKALIDRLVQVEDMKNFLEAFAEVQR
jgi:mannitol/fructose-specific phosphotransferase system IIA component (Ntr-type)